MTEGMMGRSSDTRMYAPRSESSHMFRENHEDERTRTGYEDPRDREGKADKRQAKKEKEEEEDRGIRHIKVRRHHLSAMHDDEEEEEGLDDSTKLDADREVGLQTNPMGTGGFLTSLAMGAKGPGAAHGHMVATGEPMEHAWSSLLKTYTRDTDETMGEESFLERIETDVNRGIKPATRRELDKRSFYGKMTQEEADAYNRMTAAERQEKYGVGGDSVVEPEEIDTTLRFDERERAMREAEQAGQAATDEEKLYAEMFEQMKNASEPMFIGDVLVKAPPYKPKGLPTGVPHAVNTGKSRAETERDIHADIQRRNRTNIPVMSNLNESLLTSAQREQLPAMRNLIARYGGVANIPPKRLFHGGVANFLPASQTVAVEKPFRGYPGERRVNTRAGVREKGQPLTFANLRPSKIEDNLTAQFLPTAAHAVEAGDYMADLATFAHNIGRFSDDRMANINAPLPEPTPEPTPEPQPVQEDKIEPGPLPDTYYVNGDFMDARQFAAYQAQKNGEQKSEPMDRAWSELLKSKRMKEKKDKDEESKKFRPSTGAFDRPKGGFGGRPMTPARAKIISRNLPVGRHTGLNEAELSVEMSHRGVASKQPKSKDPQQYLDYMATQEAQKRLGNVRTPSGEHRRFGRPSLRNIPHPQKPRLHPVRAPRIQPPKGVRKPRLNKPKMPSIVTMSEDDVAHSDLMKSRSDVGQMRILVRELREALRDARDKDKKRKGMGTPDTSGAASNLPNHPSNSANQTSKPQGGTENEEAEAKMYGADPAQVINARGSNRS